MSSSSRILPALLAAVSCAAVLASASGCSGAADAAAPAPAATPTVLNSTALRLPTADYLLTPDSSLQLGKASQLLMSQCMKRYGLTFTDAAPTAESGPATPTEMRYGVTSTEQAKTTGYHFGPADPGYLPNSAPKQDAPQDTDPGYQLALAGNGTPGKPGTATTYHGQPVGPNGCAGEMHTKLQDGATFLGQAALVQQINDESFTDSLKAPAVQKVFQAWSACMLAKGFRYATPLDAVNDKAFAGATASPTELLTAQADVDCKQQDNVVGVWFTADADRQRALMAPHAGELETIRSQMQGQAAVIADVLRSGGAG